MRSPLVLLGLSVVVAACAEEDFPCVGATCVTRDATEGEVVGTGEAGHGGGRPEPSPVDVPRKDLVSTSDAAAACADDGLVLDPLTPSQIAEELVGRWFLCAGQLLLSHDGIELAAEGRFHWLTAGADGVLQRVGGFEGGGEWIVRPDEQVDLILFTGETLSVSSRSMRAPTKLRLNAGGGAYAEYIAVE
jgi:hypothetical protein